MAGGPDTGAPDRHQRSETTHTLSCASGPSGRRRDQLIEPGGLIEEAGYRALRRIDNVRHI